MLIRRLRPALRALPLTGALACTVAVSAGAAAATLGSGASMAVSFTIASECQVSSGDLLRLPQTQPAVSCLHNEMANVAMQGSLSSATAVDTAASASVPENESALPASPSGIGAATWVVTF
ncbi:hypothetical protein ASB57_15330 [Bordetella sp. N]|nr:hypothetical protein ASB57_15330 [Bordetella sp. N]